MGALATGAIRSLCSLMLVALVLVAPGFGAAGGALASARDVLLVLDASGSMWTKSGTSTRIGDVRAVVPAVLKKFERTFDLGIAAFGHARAAKCGGFQRLVPIAPINSKQVSKALAGINPRGAASIAAGLTAGARLLRADTRPATMILIADGPDNCKGNPCKAALQLAKGAPNLKVHVVALSVSEDDKIPLACVAGATRGIFLAVKDRRQLAGALTRLLTTAKQDLRTARANAAAKPPEHDAIITGSLKQASAPAPVPGRKPPPPGLIKTANTDRAPVPEPPAGLARPTPANTEAASKKPTAPVAEKAAAGMETPVEVKRSDAPQKSARLDDTIRKSQDPRPAAPEFIVREEKSDTSALRLSARLTAALEPIRRPVDWTVYRVDPVEKSKWIQLIERKQAHPTITLEPGEYVVRADYGHATAAKIIVAKPNTLIDATYILNAGALRILPSLVMLAAPPGRNARQWIYPKTANGVAAKPIATSTIPGEIIRLNAGRYRLVSKFGAANAVIKTSVTIRPGRLTEIELNHKAGIARFRLTGAKAGKLKPKTHWRLRDNTGALVVEATGATLPAAVLAPGHYNLSARIEGKTYHNAFEIGAGQTKDIAVEIK